MPAPTALQRRPEDIVQNEEQQQDYETQSPIDITTTTTTTAATIAPDTELDNIPADAVFEETAMQIDAEDRPHFLPSDDTAESTVSKVQSRKVPIPPHRMTPLKAAWPKMYPPLVEHLKLQVRMNVKSRAVEMRTSRFTTDPSALQQGADFVLAFTLGFDVDDAIALLRLQDLYIESFEIKDVKTLNGASKARAVGRIAGQNGKTKFAIENASRTRIVLADSKIHILGGFSNIKIAREAVVSLILGAPPGKVYGNLRIVASRMKERF